MSGVLIRRTNARRSLAAAGASLLVAQALLPAMPGDAASQVAVGAAHRGAILGSSVAFLIAAVALVIGAAAVSGLSLGRGRRLAHVGTLLTAVGALWPAVGRASFNATLVALTGSSPRAGAVSAIHSISSSGAFAVFLPLLAAFALGPILLTAGLRREGAIAVWPALLWLAGVLIVNGAESSSRVLATVGMALVAGALIWIGRSVSDLDADDLQLAGGSLGAPTALTA